MEESLSVISHSLSTAAITTVLRDNNFNRRPQCFYDNEMNEFKTVFYGLLDVFYPITT